jgi:hypothetical protein
MANPPVPANLESLLAENGQTLALVTGLATLLYQPANDLVAIMGGAHLAEKRREIEAKLRKKTDEKLAAAGITEPIDIPLNLAKPILEPALMEDREILLDLWAGLIATARDSNSALTIRPEFIEAVKAFAPFDALVFRAIAANRNSDSSFEPHTIQQSLDAPDVDDLDMSIDKLLRLNCIEKRLTTDPSYKTTSFGRGLIRSLGLTPEAKTDLGLDISTL